MRAAQHNKRPRGGGGGRQNTGGGRKQGGQGPNRTYDSNGPDVKIRGTAPHIFEKYQQLARDAQSAGDRVAGENYLQHAEHYYRLMVASNLVPQQRPVTSNGQMMSVPGQGPQPDMSGLELMLNGTVESDGGGGGDGENEAPQFDLDDGQQIVG